MNQRALLLAIAWAGRVALAADDFPKPYSPPCVERENVFEFVEKPAVKKVGEDRYEIAFAVKGNCDVTVGIVDSAGKVVRHLGAGVLGANAPAPFQKDSLRQAVYWDGKDDLDAYVRDPGALKARVMLGLKPEFDRLLGDAGPKNIPGYIYGLAVDSRGAYVMYKGLGSHGHAGVKKFDLDGNYVCTLVPPPAGLPEEKLGGWAYVEFEPGRRALHSPDGHESVARDGFMLPEINGKKSADCQPALAGDRLLFCSPGDSVAGRAPSMLYWIHTDGSTDVEGLRGVPLYGGEHPAPRLACSPDGQWVYVIMVGQVTGSVPQQSPPVVFRRATRGPEKAAPFVGTGKPGTDNASLNNPRSLDCDAQGRLYVCDYFNNRIQVFSPEGKYLKTIPVDRPHLVRVHGRTGAIYVVHAARVEGQSIGRVSKLASLDDPREVWHLDNLTASAFALDSWSPKARLWLAGKGSWVDTGGAGGSGPSVMIWEDGGNSLRKIADFDEEAAKAGGDNYIGRFSAASIGGSGGGGKVVCDPTRDEVYWEHTRLFDLKTGEYKGKVKLQAGAYDDMAFDRRGYLHVHLNPGFEMQGVVRMDPGRRSFDKAGRQFSYGEIPYDYGVEIRGAYCAPRKGALPVKDQPGAKFFQDGIGVNMRGDVAENCNVYFVPKMDDVGRDMAMSTTAILDMQSRGEYNSTIGNKYADFQRMLSDWAKRGEEIYSIPRRPGNPLAGATIWVFDRSGELRTETAVNLGRHLAGVQIDEDGKLYFVTARPRLAGGRPFLAGRCGTFGAGAGKPEAAPFTGSLVKSRGSDVAVLSKHAPIPLEQPPARAQEFEEGWIEGAEWLYAGASPIVAGGCTCPTMRAHLDWYRRTFVPEAYRHSIGVLDAAGNLVLHIGSYGNFDSWQGPASKIRVGGDGIGLLMPRMVSGTDDYLCFQDWGERLAVLKLNYHAEETVPIQ